LSLILLLSVRDTKLRDYLFIFWFLVCDY